MQNRIEDIHFPEIKFWCKGYLGRCPTFFEPLALLCLYQKPLCGYEIFDIFKKSGIDYKIEEYGFFYKTLNLMREKGLILPACSLKNKSANVIKIVYFITEKGKAELKKWVYSLTVLNDDLTIFLNCYEDFYKK